MVGRMIVLTAFSVSACRETSSTALRTSSICVAVKRSLTNPTAPARAKMSGGTDSTAKNAASAARPVTRCRRHEPTVVTTMRHSWTRHRRTSTSTRRGAGVSSRASTMKSHASEWRGPTTESGRRVVPRPWAASRPQRLRWHP